MAAYWVSYDHLEEKLASFVQAPCIHRHPPRPASGTLRNRIPLHGTIRQKKPYAATDVQGQTVRNWERHVNRVIPTGYLAMTYRFRTMRERPVRRLPIFAE